MDWRSDAERNAANWTQANSDYTDENAIFHAGVKLNSGSPVAVAAKGVVMISGPSAVDSISGKVLSADGRPLRNAVVTLSGNSLSTRMRSATTSFGTYTFSGLQPGDTYIVTVATQRYTFAVPSRVISLVDNLNDIDFVADQ